MDIQEERLVNLTSTTGSIINDVYTNQAVHGNILKITYEPGASMLANGSLTIRVSGTVSEVIVQKNGTMTTSTVFYPMVYMVDNTNTTGSPQAFSNRYVNAPLIISASGVGATVTISGVSIFYY